MRPRIIAAAIIAAAVRRVIATAIIAAVIIAAAAARSDCSADAKTDDPRADRKRGVVTSVMTMPVAAPRFGRGRGGGYGGNDDRAIDIRVDDHAEPIIELGRLVQLALINDLWNRGWAAFRAGRRGEDLKWQEMTLAKAEAAKVGILPEVLYDTAVIRLANGDRPGARAALERALALNPKLAQQAAVDGDLAGLRDAKP